MVVEGSTIGTRQHPALSSGTNKHLNLLTLCKAFGRVESQGYVQQSNNTILVYLGLFLTLPSVAQIKEQQLAEVLSMLWIQWDPISDGCIPSSQVCHQITQLALDSISRWSIIQSKAAFPHDWKLWMWDQDPSNFVTCHNEVTSCPPSPSSV